MTSSAEAVLVTLVVLAEHPLYLSAAFPNAVQSCEEMFLNSSFVARPHLHLLYIV